MENMTNIERKIAASLSCFANENPLYFNPHSVSEWERTWDFGEYDANIYNHGLHQYPARFIPQLVRKILRTFANSDSSVMDIFSGSGTTLLECKYLGIKNSYGVELNPFAVFMTKVKLQDLEIAEIEKSFSKIKDDFFRDDCNFPLVNFKNIDFWYSKKTIYELSKIFNIVSKIQDEKPRNFFLLAFCEISRKTSFLDHGGFKMYRSRTKIKNNFAPDVWDEFQKTFLRNKKLLAENNELVFDGEARQTIVLGDSRIVHSEIPAHSIDLILTSPPYGDSKTTVAYGQYSRLPWQWLSQKDDIIALDAKLLGGSTKNLDRSILDFSKKLKEQAAEIENADNSGRIKDVIAFYNDLYATLGTADLYLKHGAYFILVTGNRTVKKVYLRTDIIITEFAETLGFSTEKIYSRNIINKRMAIKNSPTNEKGKTASTMMTENIIVLRKN
ncbi:MAG: site-specific DNA-methyltransferase [Bacteroides sp.]|nr:site-specific DNA-methyltransferase [Prevotella sp.]MCM1407820.1 site-specific DNA-methyltransferase [Treponema brennaborense]MCM1470873.1 site-specific DNA-methyltransferase [Bacteroides sp.]